MEKFERRSVKYSRKKRGVAESEGTAHLLSNISEEQVLKFYYSKIINFVIITLSCISRMGRWSLAARWKTWSCHNEEGGDAANDYFVSKHHAHDQLWVATHCCR